jgi:hypothetical protein
MVVTTTIVMTMRIRICHRGRRRGWVISVSDAEEVAVVFGFELGYLGFVEEVFGFVVGGFGAFGGNPT